MKTCPKCAYVRQPSDAAPDYECPKCGVVYSKIQAGAGAVAQNPAPNASAGRRIAVIALAVLLGLGGGGYWWHQKREHEKRVDSEVRKVTAQILGALNSNGKTIGDVIKQSDEAAEEILKARKQWFERTEDDADAGIVFRRKYADAAEGFMRQHRALYVRYVAKRAAMESLSAQIELYSAAPAILSVPTADNVEQEAKAYHEAKENVAQAAAQTLAVIRDFKPDYVGSTSVLSLAAFQQALSNHGIVLK